MKEFSKSLIKRTFLQINAHVCTNTSSDLVLASSQYQKKAFKTLNFRMGILLLRQFIWLSKKDKVRIAHLDFIFFH